MYPLACIHFARPRSNSVCARRVRGGQCRISQTREHKSTNTYVQGGAHHDAGVGCVHTCILLAASVSSQPCSGHPLVGFLHAPPSDATRGALASLGMTRRTHVGRVRTMNAAIRHNPYLGSLTPAVLIDPDAYVALPEVLPDRGVVRTSSGLLRHGQRLLASATRVVTGPVSTASTLVPAVTLTTLHRASSGLSAAAASVAATSAAAAAAAAVVTGGNSMSVSASGWLLEDELMQEGSPITVPIPTHSLLLLAQAVDEAEDHVDTWRRLSPPASL